MVLYPKRKICFLTLVVPVPKSFIFQEEVLIKSPSAPLANKQNKMQKLQLQSLLTTSEPHSIVALTYVKDPYGIQLIIPTSSTWKGEELLIYTKRTDYQTYIHLEFIKAFSRCFSSNNENLSDTDRQQDDNPVNTQKIFSLGCSADWEFWVFPCSLTDHKALSGLKHSGTEFNQ